MTRFAPILFLQTNTFTQSSFYAQILLHRGLCTEKLLHTGAFTRRGFYMFLHKEFFTHRTFYTNALHKDVFVLGIFTHRTFSTEKPLHRTVFCTNKILHRKTLTQRNLHQKNTPEFSLYPKQFLHSKKHFSAQKPLRIFLTHISFYRQTMFTHRNFSPQKS